MMLFILGCALEATEKSIPNDTVAFEECRQAIREGWGGDPSHCNAAHGSAVYPCTAGGRSMFCQPLLEGYDTFDWSVAQQRFVKTGSVLTDGAPVRVFRSSAEDAVVHRD